jgi:hypothetical protein
MDVRQARERAEAKLGEVQDPQLPFNSQRYLDSGDFGSMVASGPIVVNKDGSDVWIANSGFPVEKWLNHYAADRGYPALPVPEAKPFGS